MDIEASELWGLGFRVSVWLPSSTLNPKDLGCNPRLLAAVPHDPTSFAFQIASLTKLCYAELLQLLSPFLERRLGTQETFIHIQGAQPKSRQRMFLANTKKHDNADQQHG